MSKEHQPPLWIRVLLWPLADFQWEDTLEKRASNIGLARLQPIILLPGESKSVVPDILEREPVTLSLNADGTVFYEFEFIDEKKPPHVELKPHSSAFDISLPDNYRMKESFVSSDGRFVTVRLPDGQVYRVVSYEAGQWFQWLPPQGGPTMTQILVHGLRNYQHYGQTMLRPAVLIPILIVLLILDALNS